MSTRPTSQRFGFPIFSAHTSAHTRRHRPWRGGLALERDKPGLDTPILTLSPGPELVFPLLGHGAREREPWVRAGQHVERGELLATGVLASAPGTVVAITTRAVPHPSGGTAPSVVLRVDVNAADSPHDESPVLPSLQTLDPSRLERAGVGGLGGAGFLLHDKLGTGEALSGLHTLIINACECEPGIACDEALMLSRAEDIIDGCHALARALDCRRTILVIEADKHAAVAALRRAARSPRLGCESTGNPVGESVVESVGESASESIGESTGQSVDTTVDTTAAKSGVRAAARQPPAIETGLQIREVAPIYPSGAERLTVLAATGTRLPPGVRPVDQGMLCVNVATAMAAGHARTGHAQLSRVVTLGGELATRVTHVRVAFGTPVSHVLAATGQRPITRDHRLRLGGPLSGFDITDLSVPVTATVNRIGIEAAKRPAAALPCIRCAACSDVCPVELLPQELLRHALTSDFRELDRYRLDACIECACCDLVCPSNIPLTDTFRHARAGRRDAATRDEAARRAADLHERREARRTEARDSVTDPVAEALARAQSRRRSRER